MNKLYVFVAMGVGVLLLTLYINFETDKKVLTVKETTLSYNKQPKAPASKSINDKNNYIENKKEKKSKHHTPLNKHTNISKVNNLNDNDTPKLDINDLVINILNGNTNDVSTLINNMSKFLTCNECTDNLNQLLTSNTLNKELYKGIVLSIAKIDSKESAELLLQSIYKNNELSNEDNIETIQEAFAEFGSVDAMEVFAQAVFSDTHDSAYVQQLPDNAQYAIEKVIKQTSDRDYVASTLNTLYENALTEKTRNRIIAFDYPEMYAFSAVEAYGQGNTDLYNEMLTHLAKTNSKRAINGLMTLSRKIGENSLNDVLKAASQWGHHNSSTEITSLAEDYLSNAESSPEERIIAAALISNSSEKEKILDKALKHEEDGNVTHHVNQYLYAN